MNSIWMILLYLILGASGADLQQAKAPSATEIMPRDCFVFAEVRPVPTWDALIESLANEKLARQMQGTREQLFGEIARGLKCQTQDLEDLFDKVDGLAYGMWGMAGDMPELALVVTFEDAAAAQRLGDMLAGTAAMTTPTPWGTRYEYDDGMLFGVAGQRVLLAPGAENLDKVGFATSGPSGGLAQSPEFRAIRQRVVPDRPGLCYVNGRILVEQIHGTLPDRERQQLALIDRLFDLQNVEGAMLTLKREGDLILGDVVVNAPANRTYSLLQGPPRDLGPVTSCCPGDVALAAICNVPHLAGRWDRIDSHMGSLFQEEWQAAKDEMREEMDIDLNEGFLRRLRGDGGMFLRPKNQQQFEFDEDTLALLTGFKSSDDASSVIEGWRESYWGNATFQEKQVDSTTVFWTRERGKLAYAVHDGMLVFGPEPEHVEASIADRTSRKDISSSGVPARLLNTLPEKASGLFIADLMAVTQGGLRMIPGMPDDVWGAAALLLPEEGPHAQFLIHAPLAENQ